MTPSFSSLLSDGIDKKYGSRRAFMRVSEPSGNEDGAVSYLSRVISGKRPPPLDRIEAWADALDLAGEERETFLDLAALEHLPAPVRARHIGIYHAFKAQEARIIALEAAFKGGGK